MLLNTGGAAPSSLPPLHEALDLTAHTWIVIEDDFLMVHVVWWGSTLLMPAVFEYPGNNQLRSLSAALGGPDVSLLHQHALLTR